MNVLRHIVINAGNLTATKAKLEAKGQDGRFLMPGLPGSFTTPLSSTGNLPATRYASSGYYSAEEAAYLEAELPKSVDISDGTYTDAEGNVVQEDAHAFFARLNLKMIQGDV
jgi:hypothetical protein